MAKGTHDMSALRPRFPWRRHTNKQTHRGAPSLNRVTSHAPEEDLTGEMLLITLAARLRH